MLGGLLDYDPAKRRAATLKRFGLTIAQYEMLLRVQGGACAICHRRPSPTRCFDVDHDHRTKEIRGLLCFLCNKGLGYFKNPEQLMRAAAYMRDAHAGYYMPKKKRRR